MDDSDTLFVDRVQMDDRLRRITIEEHDSLVKAMQAIDRGGAEIALVTDSQGRLKAILTDGDIRRAILSGCDLESAVRPVMNCNFVAVTGAENREQVLDLMRARTLSQIPILDAQGRLVGLHLLREIVGAVQRPNWAVIMAGGRGERLKPLTDSMPKPMIPVAGRPILERIVLHLVGHGIRTIYLSVNYKAEMIEAHFGRGESFGCHIDYLREEQPLGTGGALSLLPQQASEPLFVLNGDLLTQFDVGAMLDTHRASNAMATVAVQQHHYTVPYGVVEAQDGLITALREKPTQTWRVNAGIYLLEPTLPGRVPKDVNYPLPGLIEDCLAKGEPVATYALEEDWIDVGLPHHLRRARGDGL